MARYTGPRTKIARKFKEPIFGSDKYFERRNYPPGQHGQAKSVPNYLNMVCSCKKNKKQNTPMVF